ncbi:MAG: hypothetical protein CL942_13830 [Desulfovibrio sp.]|nr:hypothetical protein [Desulfovibrio sp.]
MRKMLIMSNDCLECVFHRKRCMLGKRRPWNASRCDDYRPYCLICNYPRLFCNTCRNNGFRYLKPLREKVLTRQRQWHHGDYDCVWQPSTQSQ